MKYVIEEKTVLIKHCIFKDRIDLDKITKVKLGRRKTIFYGQGKPLLSCNLSLESYELADILLQQYACKEMEYDEICFDQWRKINVGLLEEEAAIKERVLHAALDKFRERVQFELSGRMILNYVKFSAMYDVIGHQDGKKIIVSNGKKSVEWGVGIPVIAPNIISSDSSKNILAVDDNCTEMFEIQMDRALRYVESNGYSLIDDSVHGGFSTN